MDIPRRWLGLLATLSVLLLGCSTGDDASQPKSAQFDTTIRWTSYGIPHVKANDWGSLGYGYAYATAKDGLCVIAKDLITVRGEQARYFPDAADALASDVFHTAIISPAKIDAYLAAQDEEGAQFNQGYVAGYNRYLADHSDQASSCQGASWVRPIDQADLVRLQIGVGIRYGLARFAR